MQNYLSTLKCKTHQKNQVQYICFSEECQAIKLCCFNCQETHSNHHSFLQNVDSAWEKIIEHKQKQIVLNTALENLWSQIFDQFPQLDQIINFNKFLGFNLPYIKQTLVELEKELISQLNCQELSEIIQKHKDMCISFDQKVEIYKTKYCITNILNQGQIDKQNKLDVDTMLSLFNEARQLYKKREKQKAIEKYTQVLELNENCILARLDRGKMNIGLNYEQAQYDFEEVLKQDNQNVRALKGLALSYKMKCNFEEALFYAQKGQKLNESSPQINFYLADCYKFEGKNKEALHFINRAIDLKKSKYEHKMKIYYKNKAEILLGLNDLQNAYTFINKALDIYQHYVLAINIKERINMIAKKKNIIL